MRCKACDRQIEISKGGDLCGGCALYSKPSAINELTDSGSLIRDGFWRPDQETYSEENDPLMKKEEQEKKYEWD